MSLTPISLESCPAACKPSGIFQQFSKPTGWVGWCIGQLMAVKNRKRSEWVIELIQVQRGDRILEVGFGSGVDICRVSALATDGFVAGIDRSDVMVQQAKNRNAHAIRSQLVELHCASAEAIPYPDAMFDKIFAINVAHFWTNPVEVLAELQRVLKPGGLMALAIQPRIPNATEETSQETGKFLVNLLTNTGFEQVRLETKPMQPVSVVCVLANSPESPHQW
jgi:ubiquinone/menaquinone biosynthesis C-methylase UbiE